MLTDLNQESVLLLYLADELSDADRAEVDQRLASDAGLKAELQKLEAAQSSFASAMSALDARPAPLESLAMRRIGSAMRQRMVERLGRPAGITKPRGLRYPWWAYPTASAAAVFIALLCYWGMQPDGSAKSPAVVVMPPGPPVDRSNLTHPSFSAPDGLAQNTPGEQPPAVAMTPEEHQASEIGESFVNSNSTHMEKSIASLDVAEHHLDELSRSRDQAVPSVFGFNDGNE